MDKDRLFENACEMFKIDGAVLGGLKDSLSAEMYYRVFEMIRSCKGRIVTVGMGTSSVAARKLRICCV